MRPTGRMLHLTKLSHAAGASHLFVVRMQKNMYRALATIKKEVHLGHFIAWLSYIGVE